MSDCASAQSCPNLSDIQTIANQAPLPKEFSRQEYWSGLLSFSTPGIFPIQGLNLHLLCLLDLQVDSLPLYHLGSPQNRINGSKYLLPCVLLQQMGISKWAVKEGLQCSDTCTFRLSLSYKSLEPSHCWVEKQ